MFLRWRLTEDLMENWQVRERFCFPVHHGNKAFSHDVTAAILLPQTLKRRPCWCSKQVLWELNSFLMQTLSFVPINLHRCWPRDWKHPIDSIRHTFLIIVTGTLQAEPLLVDWGWEKEFYLSRIKPLKSPQPYLLDWSILFSLVNLACEQALRGGLAAGREKEGERVTTSLEFEFRLQFPCGSPSTELSDCRQSARSGNERECKQTL